MYSDIVPADLQDELIVIRDSVTENNFRIGDIVLQVIREKPEVGLMQVYSAVGMFSGKQARTVREYTAVSAMYPVEVRREFSVLAFDHFRVAMRLGERWYEALAWAVRAGDEFNRPATVEAMLGQFGDKQVSDNLTNSVPEATQESEAGQLLYHVQRIKTMLYLSADLVKQFPQDLADALLRVLTEVENSLKSEKAVL